MFESREKALRIAAENKLKKMNVKDAYTNDNAMCDGCGYRFYKRGVLYHCMEGEVSKMHPLGFDVCLDCVGCIGNETVVIKDTLIKIDFFFKSSMKSPIP